MHVVYCSPIEASEGTLIRLCLSIELLLFVCHAKRKWGIVICFIADAGDFFSLIFAFLSITGPPSMLTGTDAKPSIDAREIGISCDVSH